MRLRYVEIFHAVMQCGSVKAAADLLHITQPAASRLLQQAEQNLGFALFRRERGRLVATQEAHRLFAEVQPLYDQLDAVRRLAENLALGQAGVLRVLCVPSLAEHWMTQALRAVERRYPQARMSLRTLYSPQIAASLARREADVGFAFEAAQHPAVTSTAIAEGELVSVGAWKQPELRLADLASVPVIGLDETDPLGRLLHAALRQQGVQLRSSVIAHNYHSAVTLARQGMGHALVDSFTGRLAAAQHPSADWACVPVRPRFAISVHALRPQGVQSSAQVDELIRGMQAALAEHA